MTVIDTTLRISGCIFYPIIAAGISIRFVVESIKTKQKANYVELEVDRRNYLEDTENLRKEFEESISSCKTKTDLEPRHFEWMEVLGNGCYGEVLLAKSKLNSIEYAVKVYNKEKILRYSRVQNLNRERIIQNSITHPFIVKLLYTFSTARDIFIVMDSCPGGNLYNLLGKSKHFSDGQVRFYSAQMFMALDFLHSLNIMHRDIKLENFVIGSDGYLKLTDFGFAKIVEGRTGTLCGSKVYIAPEILEQFLGLRRYEYGFVADWWSYGICLFFMSAGRAPYPGDAIRDLHEDIKKDSVDYPEHMDDNLRDLVKQLLVVDPGHRLGSTGTDCIRYHSWFDGLDWAKLFYREIESPVIPSEKFQDFSGNFDSYSESPDDEFRDF